jgi:hypothetical protein
MARQLISSKTLWGLHLAQGRAEEISAWVAANGIDPADVSTGHDLIVEDSPDGRQIWYRAFLRALDGSKYVDEHAGGAATEERTAPLIVLPPEHWPAWALNDERPQP